MNNFAQLARKLSIFILWGSSIPSSVGHSLSTRRRREQALDAIGREKADICNKSKEQYMLNKVMLVRVADFTFFIQMVQPTKL
mmetsp:Transcript_24033/g.28247  ORF Transcript_24033/g.28247 Transcript_24033/m.28247 type:complete len:83 (-) Transcript_24033:1090-1338(-)